MAHPLVQRLLARAAAHLGAALQQDVRGTLGHDGHPALVAGVRVDDAHELALGGEGNLTHPLEAALAAPVGAELALGDEEGALRGVADDGPHALVVGQLGVGGHGTAREHDRDLGELVPGKVLDVGGAVAVGVG